MFDLRQDVDRHSEQGQRCRQQDQQRHHDERVGGVQRDRTIHIGVGSGLQDGARSSFTP